MSAIAERFDPGEAAVRFLEAGGDLVLICHAPDRQRAAVAAVEEAARTGRLSEARLAASRQRIARLREWIAAHRSPVDVTAARAIVGAMEHERLLQGLRPTPGHSA
jgi:beta-N-acetylhexosaminidase